MIQYEHLHACAAKKVVEDEFHGKLQDMIDESYEGDSDSYHKLLTGQLSIILYYKDVELVGVFDEIDLGDYESMRIHPSE